MNEPGAPRIADLWQWDPTAGRFTHTNPDGTVIDSSLEEASGGRWRIVGRGIQDLQTGLFRGSVSNTTPTLFVNFGEGDMYRVWQIDPSEANTVTNRSAITGLMFSGEVTFSNGFTFNLGDTFATVHPIGEVLATRGDPNDNRNIVSVPLSLVDWNTRTIPSRPDLTILKGEDAVDRAMIGIILSRYRDELGRLLLSGVADETGKLIDKPSELAAYLVRVTGGSASVGRLEGF